MRNEIISTCFLVPKVPACRRYGSLGTAKDLIFFGYERGLNSRASRNQNPIITIYKTKKTIINVRVQNFKSLHLH